MKSKEQELNELKSRIHKDQINLGLVSEQLLNYAIRGRLTLKSEKERADTERSLNRKISGSLSYLNDDIKRIKETVGKNMFYRQIKSETKVIKRVMKDIKRKDYENIQTDAEGLKNAAKTLSGLIRQGKVRFAP